MIYDIKKKYPTVSKKVCDKIHNIIYDWELDKNDHWNRATFSSKMFFGVMETIEELFFMSDD